MRKLYRAVSVGIILARLAVLTALPGIGIGGAAGR
jgi:hypothetical protein